MSTRREKTRQRKLARLEDWELVDLVLERLDEIGSDPDAWNALELNELREKYEKEEEDCDS